VQNVPLVDYVDEAEAPRVVRDIFDAVRKNQGKLPNSRSVMAHNPDILRAFGPFIGAMSTENPLANRLNIPDELVQLMKSTPASAELAALIPSP
jgi:hypothetical protein